MPPTTSETCSDGVTPGLKPSAFVKSGSGTGFPVDHCCEGVGGSGCWGVRGRPVSLIICQHRWLWCDLPMPGCHTSDWAIAPRTALCTVLPPGQQLGLRRPLWTFPGPPSPSRIKSPASGPPHSHIRGGDDRGERFPPVFCSSCHRAWDRRLTLEAGGHPELLPSFPTYSLDFGSVPGKAKEPVFVFF